MVIYYIYIHIYIYICIHIYVYMGVSFLRVPPVGSAFKGSQKETTHLLGSNINPLMIITLRLYISHKSAEIDHMALSILTKHEIG